MKKIVLLFIITMVLLRVASLHAQEKQNLLSNFFTRKFVAEVLLQNNDWIKYPSYHDRESWSEIPEIIRQKTIQEGEKYLGCTWPNVTLTMYLEFSRSGDRSAVDNPNRERARALQSLVYAELMEGEGRFMDDIINGVFSFCEQTYWGSSAHFYMYGGAVSDPTTIVPDSNDPIVDLVVGDRVADLSWIWYFLHEEFDKISPVISKRLKDEIKTKVLNPFYERYDYWWITGWGEGRVNNWNPWCNYNMLTSILLIEDDMETKQNAIFKTMESVDLFINSYPEDGGCNEGPSYWGVAGGKLFDYLDLLNKSTNGKINIFGNELIKNIGRYIYRVYISKGQYYINFADAPLRTRHDPGRIFRYGNIIGDETMKGFGVFLKNEYNYEQSPVSGRIGEALEKLFNTNWEDTKSIEPLTSEYYFPDLDIALGRDRAGTADGFYFAAKGGSNGEGHNHNDVGSFMLYFNGDPVLIDVGVGTYTRKTFSPQRYEIWTMQSNFHNLPVINGVGQNPGGLFRAKDSKYISTENKVTYSTEISGAYPLEAKVKNWQRTYTLKRRKNFSIEDSFTLLKNNGNTSLHFMTGLSCQISKPGIVEFKGDDFTIHLKYNPSALNTNIEKINIEDERLINALGKKISRVVFELQGNELKGNISFEIIEAK